MSGMGVFAARLLELCDYVQSWGDLGPMIYTIILMFAIVFCLPCTIFEIIPGFLFGIRVGFVVTMIGKNLGNLICVLLAKTVLSGYVRRTVLPKLPNGQVLERMIKNQGFAAICIFRGLVYAPLPVKNYGMGALDIPTSQIIWAAILTGSPFCLWWAYLGSKAKNLVDIIDGRAEVRLFSMPTNPLASVVVAILAIAAGGYLFKKAKAAWEVARAEIAEETVKQSKN